MMTVMMTVVMMTFDDDSGTRPQICDQIARLLNLRPFHPLSLFRITLPARFWADFGKRKKSISYFFVQ